MAKYGQAEKESYLEYYRKEKRAKRTPLSFARWREQSNAGKGLSRQSRGQLRGLSAADYKAVRKYIK